MVLVRSKAELFSQYSQRTIQSICLIAFYICNLMIFWAGWTTIEHVIWLFIAGYVVFSLRYWKQKISGTHSKLFVMRGSWVIAYIIGMAVISKLSSFGGDKMIPFGIDFVVMAAFSAGIFALAHVLTQRTAAPSTSM